MLVPAGYHARYLAGGHIVYMHEQTLFAAPFDLQRLEITGQAVPVLERVMGNVGTGGAQFAFSASGNIVYVSGTAGGGGLQIFWLDRSGKFEPLRKTTAGHFRPRFSPDGKLLAVEMRGTTGRDVWLYDWRRDTLTRLTFDADSGSPVWTADGQRVTFSSGQAGISWKRADGSGDVQRLLESPNVLIANSWHPNGRILAFTQQSSETAGDIWTLPVEGDEKSGWKPGKPMPLVQTRFIEAFPVFSPDGRWLAYMSDETGMMEVYVRPFPGPGGKWQISSGGGLFPVWSRNGRELFYRTTSESRLMAVNYTAAGGSFRADQPRLWSEASFSGMGTNWNFDLHPDGKRFAVLKNAELETDAPLDHVILIFNFDEELRRKVPAGKK